jgi:hypothetical protein
VRLPPSLVSFHHLRLTHWRQLVLQPTAGATVTDQVGLEAVRAAVERHPGPSNDTKGQLNDESLVARFTRISKAPPDRTTKPPNWQVASERCHLASSPNPNLATSGRNGHGVSFNLVRYARSDKIQRDGTKFDENGHYG